MWGEKWCIPEKDDPRPPSLNNMYPPPSPLPAEARRGRVHEFKGEIWGLKLMNPVFSLPLPCPCRKTPAPVCNRYTLLVLRGSRKGCTGNPQANGYISLPPAYLPAFRVFLRKSKLQYNRLRSWVCNPFRKIKDKRQKIKVKRQK